jgi:hypothetical protein
LLVETFKKFEKGNKNLKAIIGAVYLLIKLRIVLENVLTTNSLMTRSVTLTWKSGV